MKIKPESEQLLSKLLSDPEWPRITRPKNEDLVKWKQTWREAALQMLLTGIPHAIGGYGQTRHATPFGTSDFNRRPQDDRRLPPPGIVRVFVPPLACAELSDTRARCIIDFVDFVDFVK